MRSSKTCSDNSQVQEQPKRYGNFSGPIRKFGGVKALAFGGFIIACFFLVILFLWQIKQHNILTKGKSARKAGQPIPVDVYQADTGKLNLFIPVECVSKSFSLIPIYSSNRYNEIVKSSFTKVNDKVTKGQLLIELEAGREMLELENAKTHLSLLTKEAEEGYKTFMDWTKRNRDKGLGLEREYLQSKIDWLHARTLVEKAAFEVKLKRKEIDRKKISAPADGVVVEVAKPGQATLVGTVSLITLAVVDPIQLECPISEDKKRFLAPGQPISASFYSYPDEKYKGTIAYIKPIADSEQRSISVIIEIPNHHAKLLPGLHGVVKISKAQGALIIPGLALLAGATSNEAQVFVVDPDQRIHIKTIQIGLDSNGFTEVISGLKTGDKVVIAGQFDLREGDKVRIVSKNSVSKLD